MDGHPTNTDRATDDVSVPSSRRAARLEARTRRRRFTLLAVAAVAVVSIAVGFAVAALSRSSGSPDFTAELNATAVAPSAHASADFTGNKAGFRVELDAQGLPTLSAGRYYEAWLQNSAGKLVALGTFSSSHGQLALWSGVSPSTFPLMTVTLEEAGGDHSSLGPRVLAGEVHAR